MMKGKPTKCIFKVNHTFKIPTCSYVFRRFRSAIFREPKVILPKLCVCYVISAEYVKVGSRYRLVLSVGREWITVYVLSVGRECIPSVLSVGRE
jgi:hypothetical protein